MKKLKILGIDYDIKFSCGNAPGSASSIGQQHSTQCSLWVDTTNNSPAHQKSVLIHEIIEAINFRLELRLEHEKITQLEAGLFQVLTDNPQLLEYLRTNIENTPGVTYTGKVRLYGDAAVKEAKECFEAGEPYGWNEGKFYILGLTIDRPRLGALCTATLTIDENREVK